MKSITISLLMLLLFSTIALSFQQWIVSGNQPGEIYFIGVHPTLYALSGFYYSQDYGETIELRGSQWEYGRILADAQDSTFYQLKHIQYLSTNGGLSWDSVNTNNTYAGYASGIIPGEVYRDMGIYYDGLERSDNYGVSYWQCQCNGVPDSLVPGAVALGPDSGEVFMLCEYGYLFYSNDYAENFTFLNDLHTNFGLDRGSIINGGELGEFFVFHMELKKVWRVFDYGDSASLIMDLPGIYSNLYGGITATDQPGELYILVLDWGMSPGGTMLIFHTTDYFQNYTMYEHFVEWENVPGHSSTLKPSENSIKIWPNPANASFNISYDLNSVQEVQLNLYNVLGQVVWHYYPGFQATGSYNINITNDQMPSGSYFLQLNTGSWNTVRTITIVR